MAADRERLLRATGSDFRQMALAGAWPEQETPATTMRWPSRKAATEG
jgi:hypothetical protein